MTDKRKDEMPDEIWVTMNENKSLIPMYVPFEGNDGRLSKPVKYRRDDFAPTDGDAEKAFDDLLDYLQASACGKIAMKYDKFNPKDAVKAIRSALQSTRKPFMNHVHACMNGDTEALKVAVDTTLINGR